MKNKIVKTQRTYVRKNTKVDYNAWLSTRAKRNDEGEAQEPFQANPDTLGENVLTNAFERGDKSKKCWAMYEAAIKKLPEKQRDVWKLYYREQMAESAIGDALDISQQAVSELLKRAYNNIVSSCQAKGLEFDRLKGD